MPKPFLKNIVCGCDEGFVYRRDGAVTVQDWCPLCARGEALAVSEKRARFHLDGPRRWPLSDRETAVVVAVSLTFCVFGAGLQLLGAWLR